MSCETKAMREMGGCLFAYHLPSVFHSLANCL